VIYLIGQFFYIYSRLSYSVTAINKSYKLLRNAVVEFLTVNQATTSET